MKKDKNTGSQLELTSLMTEYKNQFDRSNKLDNKVYITITFCGFLFVFIIGLFNGISQLVKPQDRLQLFVSVLYILSCIAVMGAYAYVLVFFMRLLQPEQIARMDPEIMQKEHLDNTLYHVALRWHGFQGGHYGAAAICASKETAVLRSWLQSLIIIVPR